MKNLKGNYWSYFLLFIIPVLGIGQSDSERIEINGYIKDLNVFSTEENFTNSRYDHIIHNRLNFRFYPDSSITVGIEMRNRLFFGSTVKDFPLYGEVLAHDSGLIDLSWLIVDNSSVIILSQIDRAWLNWSSNDWDIRIGRQRINWGTNLFWNANDLFNAYSLIDFDYEERPGTDALRIQRYFKNGRQIDFALKPGKNSNEWISAVRYAFNKSSYDYQLIAALWNNDWMLGMGWAGNIGLAGFKGEMSYFQPRNDFLKDAGILSASISIDYMFSSQLFLTGGFLFNSVGLTESLGTNQNLFTGSLSAKILMPIKYNFLLSLAYPISPLFNVSMVQIYSPGVNSLLLMPSFGYSLQENWELAFFAQSFFLEVDGFNDIANGFYLRLKGNF